MIIHPIKAFSDNYIWCIQEETEAVIVDPGEAKGVLDYLEEKQLRLAAILLTHKHEDHTGGIQENCSETSGKSGLWTERNGGLGESCCRGRELL